MRNHIAKAKAVIIVVSESPMCENATKKRFWMDENCRQTNQLNSDYTYVQIRVCLQYEFMKVI